MIPSDIIAKKRNGEELKSADLSWFITKYLSDDISEAQMSALLMAIYFNGMTEKELLILVDEMIHSGHALKFEKSDFFIADKHSTGGVGDKTSIILAPVMAAAGIRIPMIAGRGLEYTGGTIDKLEAIPGINVTPSLDKFKSWVENIGCAIISQSKEICPADNKIYALRNQTATVPSIPIICSSIMSKKIAEGIMGLVMDIKVGNGAFMKTKNDALKLNHLIKKIAISYRIKIDIIFSDMNQPLGRYAGLGCEINEAIDCLKGNGSQDLIDNTFELCSCLLIQAGKAKDKQESKEIFDKIIETGEAFEFFQKMIFHKNERSCSHSTFFTPGGSPRRPQIDPRSSQDGLEELLFSSSPLTSIFIRFGSVLGALLATFWGPIWFAWMRLGSSFSTRGGPRGPKRHPRGPQWAPRGTQEASKTPLRGQNE